MGKNVSKLAFSLFFFFLSLRIFFTEMAMAQKITIPVNVGVILDFDTWVGKMGLSCISLALSDFYASHGYYKTRLVLNTRDSERDVVGAAAAALDLLKNVEVQAIIGPATSMQASFVADLGDKAQVPIISFSATSSSLSSARNPYFIRATENDSSQVKAISAIVQAFGWREAVPIYIDNDYGNGFLPFLTDALQEIDTRVPYRSVIPPSATDDQIVEELYKLMTMQTRVFIVHMLPTLSSRLFLKANELGMMSEGYVWIITDGLTILLSSMDPSVIDSMQGVLGVIPYVWRTKELEAFSIRWKKKFQQGNPIVESGVLNIFGLWAYDAASALAMAVERVEVSNFGYLKMNISRNSTDLETFGVSQIGPNLRQALLSTRFKGLSGDFIIVDGQLQSSAFHIVNVIGNGGKGIGFWTAKNGIVRKLNVTNTSTYSTSKANLGAIIWPGESTSVPKGWVIPTNGKKLRIGVPMKDGFREFVNVTQDNSTNTTKVTGYCIDVFNAVMATLPYDVSYEYIPFVNPDGESAGSYDDLVYQVYVQNYDAVVGDTTIIANRSIYVDFTLPFRNSGVSMIVPTEDQNTDNAWVFLTPWTRDLWVTTASFFIFIGIVTWVFEHRINQDFRGPPLQQASMILWFSFATMVYAHRERVVSNFTRVVVIIWVFVVLILSSSYTASLASMLTAQQLQPTVTDISELIQNGENVGYQEGSFVLGLLKKMNFDESNIKAYNSPEEYDEAFSKGTANGGIAAAFDEIPYIKVLLARYCSKYAMVGPTYKTDGFGFAFPRGSPLVPDVSRAILTVTEGDKMVEIENAWFPKQTSCPDPSTSGSSNSLSLEDFWGLFLIVGVASSLALIISMAMFLYEHWDFMTRFKASVWRKIVALARRFDQKDLTSHNWKIVLENGGGIYSIDGMGAVEASPTTNCPPSPSSISSHTDGNFVSFVEQGMSSAEYNDPNPNGQAPKEIMSTNELTNSNQERLRTPVTMH